MEYGIMEGFKYEVQNQNQDQKYSVLFIVQNILEGIAWIEIKKIYEDGTKSKIEFSISDNQELYISTIKMTFRINPLTNKLIAKNAECCTLDDFGFNEQMSQGVLVAWNNNPIKFHLESYLKAREAEKQAKLLVSKKKRAQAFK